MNLLVLALLKRHMLLLFVIIPMSVTTLLSQNNRKNIHENIGWYSTFLTYKLNSKFSLHGEYQWRRDNIIKDWQQGLTRIGLNYQASPRVVFRVGYANAETFAYGEIPINGLGRNFSEHRIYQMAQLSQKEGRVDITHRFMLEQRFIGRYSSASVEKEDEFPLLHRMRYLVRLQVPLVKKESQDKMPYVAVFDEILIGFGKNVNANIFDQNRIGFIAGYRFNSKYRVETGFINQILQFGRLVNGQNIFQRNNGLMLSLFLNF